MDRFYCRNIYRTSVWGNLSARVLVCVFKQTFMESARLVVWSSMDCALSDDGDRSLVGLETVWLG